MRKKKILVARAIFADQLAELERDFEVESNQQDIIYLPLQLREKLRGKDAALITSSERIDRDTLSLARDLRAVCNIAVGFNNIDLEAASVAGVMITNTPDVLDQTTADFGWALLMATARRVTESEQWLRAGHWQQWRIDDFLGADLHGTTIGILGMGRIGQAIARRSSGFDMQVLYHNRTRLSPDLETRANNARWCNKQDLLASADHLMLVLPYSPATHHSIGAVELSLMKPSATLVNIARGGIVDDTALIAALRNRTIAAAGLDVFENEPRLHADFLTLSNVVLTPHIASASAPTRRAMVACASANLIAALNGRIPPNLLNPAMTRKG